MFQALKLPAQIEHPVVRHVLGILEEGRWSRSRGVAPALWLSLGCVGLLIVARHLWLPRGAYSVTVQLSSGATKLYPLGGFTPIFYALLALPLPLCWMSGFWTGWTGTGRLTRDPRLRDLFLAGARRETLEALRTGLTGQALILPVVLHHAIFLYFVRDNNFQALEISSIFLWLVMAAIFLVAAGPALDFGLALGMRERLRGRSAPRALAVAAGHLAAATVALAVGLGVFGLIYLSHQAASAGAEIEASGENLFEEG